MPLTKKDIFSQLLRFRVPQILAYGSTGLNMICGLIGILFALQSNLYEAFRFMLLGVIFDFLDGRFARLAPTKSDWGVYADSFADFVTFGILPGYMILFGNVLEVEIGFIPSALIFAAIYTICTWIRLIRYATKPTGIIYEGLAASVAAMLIGATMIFSKDPNWYWLFPESGIILTPFIVLVSVLMISRVIYPSPKRMLPLDVVITISGIIFGIVYIIYPSNLTALLVLFCMLVYTFFGPVYLRLTTNTRFTPEEIADSFGRNNEESYPLYTKKE
ncbi:MAG: CDP-alcohol phosphatidyltransferase family protein [Candidatus Hodarchaeota archaeon]